MNEIDKLFFELIRVAIGTQETLSRLPSCEEWRSLFDMAKKQSLIGVCFVAVQRLTGVKDTINHKPYTIHLQETLYLTWLGMAVNIQQRNEVVNEQCVALQKRLSAEGFKSCVLKGQGVGTLYRVYDNDNEDENCYPNDSLESTGSPTLNHKPSTINLQLLRQSGDIDIWMDGGFERVNAWVQKVAPTKVVNQHHIDLKMFDETEVEAHFHPINMTNPWRQKRLKKFIKDHEDECLTDVIDDKIHVPTCEFNLVFIMIHIFHHLFTEGVGLRQVMDYYFVVKHEIEVEKGSNVREVKKVISELGLNRFASALMYVMHTVFGLDEQSMLWKPNVKDGKFLLDEIMISGNFGKQDYRQKGLYENKWNSFWMVNGKTFRFWRFDHWAWFWSPIERIRGYAWRRMHGYRQY